MSRVENLTVANLFRFALLASWLVLVALLVRGPENATAPSAGEPFAAPAPQGAWEGWMGIYMQGRKVGYSHHRVSPDADGFRVEDRSVLRMRVMESDQTIYAGATARTAADYSLREFSVTLRSDIATLKVEGRVAAGSVRLEMDSGGEVSRQEIPLDGPIYLPSAARAQIAEQLQPGARLSVAVFDPSAMGTAEMVIEVVGREALPNAAEAGEVWKVRESFRGVASDVWLDDAGRALREQGPLGMLAVREPAEKATAEGWNEGTPVDLMSAVAIPVQPPLPAPRQQAELRVRLGGLGGLVLPRDSRQRLDGDVLTIRREPLAGRTFTLPNTEQRFADDLRATPFLQTDNARVRAQSAAIVAGETDARRAAEAIRRWVYDHLEKRAVVSIPNAVQVLEMGAGDCNEHAVLFAALARSSGLPARVVAGIVYSEGVFLYHAWNEVWLGDDWVSVDAAFDQMPADATHIKLIVGGPDTHVTLVPVIGQLSVQVVADPAPSRG
jgi:hypothetical protein